MSKKNIQLSKKISGWFKLATALFLLWIFAFVLCPVGEKHIPVFNEIVKTIEEQNIDSSAYFYTGIEASYTGSQDILGSIVFKSPQQAGFTTPAVLGIIICLFILFLGFYYLP